MGPKVSDFQLSVSAWLRCVPSNHTSTKLLVQLHLSQAPQQTRDWKYLRLLVLHNILHYVLPENPLISTSPANVVVWSWHFRALDAQVPVLCKSSSRSWWPHHHCNGWKWFWPHISCWGEKMPFRFLVPGCLANARSFQVGSVVGYLLCNICIWASTICGFHRWGTTNLSRRFHSVQPPQDPVTKMPTNLYVSMLYIQVNFKSNIKNSTCSPLNKLTDPRVLRADKPTLNPYSQSISPFQTQKIRSSQCDLP